MKFFKYMKDGGPESKVWGFWFIEWKQGFSIALLHFKDGSRDAYHSHAFDAVSWLLKGTLIEDRIDSKEEGQYHYFPSVFPIWTPRKCYHMVTSIGDSLALSFRGPWAKAWKDKDNKTNKEYTLPWGRKVLDCDDFC